MVNVLAQIDANEFLSRLEFNKAKLIYLDPPFELELEAGYKDLWRHKIYLEFLYPIFYQARLALRDDGFVAINIPHNYRGEIQIVLQEIFGKDNYEFEIIIPGGYQHHSKYIRNGHESILVFKKSSTAKLNTRFLPFTDDHKSIFKYEDAHGSYRLEYVETTRKREFLLYEFKGLQPSRGHSWKYTLEKMNELAEQERLLIKDNKVFLKRYLSESAVPLTNVWSDITRELPSDEKTNFFSQQPMSLLNRLIDLLAVEGDLIVDPLCGSGTSLLSAINLGMTWYGADINSNAIETVKKRLHRCELDNLVNFQNESEFRKNNPEVRLISNPIDLNLKKYFKNPIKKRSLSVNQFRKKIAVIVGIENYQDRKEKTIHPVKYAQNDALSFKNTLLTKFNVNEEDITLFLNENATKNNLTYEMWQIIQSLSEEDQFIFYYAGHGYQHKAVNYLSTFDMHPNGVVETSLSLREMFLDPLQESRCQSGLFFIDACATRVRETHGRNLFLDFDGKELEKRIDDTSYYATFLSCSRGQTSYSSDRLHHGIWTYHLNEALNGRAQSALINDRYISDHSLMAYLRDEVPRVVRNEFEGRYQQIPLAHISSSEETALVEIVRTSK